MMSNKLPVASSQFPVKSNKGYRDLIVWQKGYDLCLRIYELTRDYPKEELYGLTSQTRRAAVSVPANIAEGQGRQGKQEFKQFLYIAQASLSELETHLLLGKDLRFISEEVFFEVDNLRKDVARLLTGLIRSLATGNR